MKLKNIKVLFFLVLFVNCYSYGQNHVEEYYSLVNKAEIHITEHKENEALRCYLNAFEIQKPFAYDIYNATVCAIHINNDTTAIKYCFQLAQKGVGQLFFNKRIFKRLKNNKNWSEILLIAKNTKESFVKKNQYLTSKLDILSERDPKVALLNRTLISKHDVEVWYQVINATDSLSSELLEIYKSEDLLCEEKIGVEIVNDTIILPNHKWDVIIRHAFQAGSYKYKQAFINVLRDGLLGGKINPHSFKMYMDFTESFGCSMDETTLYMQMGCKLYKKSFPEYFIWKIDQFRKDFYLCSLKDFEAKVFYNLNNSNNEFCIVGRPHQVNQKFENEDDKNFFNSIYKEMDIKIKNCK